MLHTKHLRRQNGRKFKKVTNAERIRTVDSFGELEIINAMGLRVFRKEISAAQAQASLREFERDLRDRVFQLTGLADSFQLPI
jgi:hypothetical protein